MITRRSAAQPVSASRAKEEEAGPRLAGRGDAEGLEGRAFHLNRLVRAEVRATLFKLRVISRQVESPAGSDITAN